MSDGKYERIDGERERQELREGLYCHDLGTSSQLIAELESVGFRLKETIDKTDEWKRYVIDT